MTVKLPRSTSETLPPLEKVTIKLGSITDTAYSKDSIIDVEGFSKRSLKKSKSSLIHSQDRSKEGTPISMDASESLTGTDLPPMHATQVVPDTAYSKYLSEGHVIPPETGVVASVGIVANDDAFRMVIPFSCTDPQKGFAGHSITVPSNVKTANIRLLLQMNPFKIEEEEDVSKKLVTKYSCTGFHTYYIKVPSHPSEPGKMIPQQCFEALKFKKPLSSITGEIQDCSITVQDGLNAIEMVIAAGLYPPDGNATAFEELFQTVVLMIQKL